MIKKIYDFLLTVNCYFLVLAAILTVVNSPYGSPVFMYTSIIGLIDAIKSKSQNGIIINWQNLSPISYSLLSSCIGIPYFST